MLPVSLVDHLEKLDFLLWSVFEVLVLFACEVLVPWNFACDAVLLLALVTSELPVFWVLYVLLEGENEGAIWCGTLQEATSVLVHKIIQLKLEVLVV